MTSSLRAIRKARGLKRCTLALLCGLPVQTLYNIESGRIKIPHRKTVKKIQAILGKEYNPGLFRGAHLKETCPWCGRYIKNERVWYNGIAYCSAKCVREKVEIG